MVERRVDSCCRKRANANCWPTSADGINAAEWTNDNVTGRPVGPVFIRSIHCTGRDCPPPTRPPGRRDEWYRTDWRRLEKAVDASSPGLRGGGCIARGCTAEQWWWVRRACVRPFTSSSQPQQLAAGQVAYLMRPRFDCGVISAAEDGRRDAAAAAAAATTSSTAAEICSTIRTHTAPDGTSIQSNLSNSVTSQLISSSVQTAYSLNGCTKFPASFLPSLPELQHHYPVAATCWHVETCQFGLNGTTDTSQTWRPV